MWQFCGGVRGYYLFLCFCSAAFLEVAACLPILLLPVSSFCSHVEWDCLFFVAFANDCCWSLGPFFLLLALIFLPFNTFSYHLTLFPNGKPIAPVVKPADSIGGQTVNFLVTRFCPQYPDQPEEAKNDPTKREPQEGDANQSDDEVEEVVTGGNAVIVTPSPNQALENVDFLCQPHVRH